MTNLKYWDNVSGTWKTIGTIQGPPGPQGAQGPQGNVGPAGATGPNPAEVRTSQPTAPTTVIWIDTDEPVPSVGAIPVVTALPASPADGSEVYYRTSTNGPLWHLRYSSAMNTLDTYGWEFLGGAPTHAEVEASSTMNGTGAYANPATNIGPQLTAPLAGIYLITAGCLMSTAYGVASGASSMAAVKIGAAATSDNERVAMIQSDMASATQPPYAWGEMTIQRTVAVNDVLLMQYKGSGGSFAFLNRRMSLLPVRVK